MFRVEVKFTKDVFPASVSELAKCPLKLVQEPLVLDAESREKMAAAAEVGSAFHRLASIALFRGDSECQCEKEAEAVLKYKEYVFRGRADYVCKCGDETVVVELKTASTKMIDEHVRQLRLYMYAVKANWGVLVYCRSGSCQHVEISEPMTEEELDALISAHKEHAPIPGSYCALCAVKTCRYNPSRSAQLL